MGAGHPAQAHCRRGVRAVLEGLPPGSLALAAVSGGTDSLALAGALAAEGAPHDVTVGAIIVDHGLQPDSAETALLAAQQCGDLLLAPVAIVQAVVAASGDGLEAAAREARYSALAETAAAMGEEHPAHVVLLGHTRDDQAEQVLLGLARGSGARSLAGMPALVVREGTPFVRPLLHLPRETTEQACAAWGLVPWEDPMKSDRAYARVRARQALADLEGDRLRTHRISGFVLPSALVTTLGEPIRRLQDEALDRALDWLQAHPGAVDVVHHHALCARAHERAGDLPVPLVSTLHTPPLPELVEPIRRAAGRGAGPGGPETLVAVSEHTAEGWRAQGVPARAVPNGVDTSAWTLGAGGERLCWFGRIVPEKAPHLAVLAAARLGMGLDLAGPVGDPAYAAQLARLCRGRDVRWRGPLRQAELADLVGSSLCTLVTPVWDEPFGQVVPESLACGTPVVAVRRGGLGEVFDRTEGVRLVAPAEDQDRLAARLAREVRVLAAAHRDPEERARLRGLAREEAVRRFSFERTVDALERVYRRAIRERGRTARPSAAPREVRA